MRVVLQDTDFEECCSNWNCDYFLFSLLSFLLYLSSVVLEPVQHQWPIEMSIIAWLAHVRTYEFAAHVIQQP